MSNTTIDAQLSYLEETKKQLQLALSEKGQPIDNNVPFRDYVDTINNLSTVKIYKSKEDMEADTSSSDKTLCLIYNDNRINPEYNTTFNYIWLPRKVTVPFETSSTERGQLMDEIDQGSANGSVRQFTLVHDTDTSKNITGYWYSGSNYGQFWFILTYKNISYRWIPESGTHNFIRENADDKPFFLEDTDIGHYSISGNEADWKYIQCFILSGEIYFGGFYQWSTLTNEWFLPKTQLDATDDTVMIGNYFGKDGVSVGTLNATQYITDQNSSDMLKWYNKYDSLFDSIDTTNITNISNFPNIISNMGPVIIPFITLTNVSDVSYGFRNCKNMYGLSTVNWNTSKFSNTKGMFQMCENLIDLNTSDWNTNNITDMSHMFYNCKILPKLNVQGWNTLNVTNMCYMFARCKTLSDLNTQGWNTSNLQDASYMFYECSSLPIINVYKFNGNNIVNAKGMFYGCTSLTNTYNVSWQSRNLAGNWNNLTIADEMFAYCTSLTNLNYYLNTPNLTSIYGMFRGCTSFQNMGGYGPNITSVTNLGSIYDGCTSLTKVVFNGTWLNVKDLSYAFQGTKINNIGFIHSNAMNIENMEGTFKGCSEISSVRSLNWTNLSNLKTINGCFQGTKVTDLNFSNYNFNALVNFESWTYGWNQINLANCTFNSLTNIGAWANNCRTKTVNISNAKFPKVSNLAMKFRDWTYMSEFNATNTEFNNLSNLWAAFENCNSLSMISLNTWNTTKVTDISYLFNECRRLQDIYLDGTFNISNVTNMYESFAHINTRFNLHGHENWDLSNVSMMKCLFRISYVLNLNVTNWNISNKVTSLYETFYGCSYLQNVDLTKWDFSGMTELASTFYGCYNLTSANLAELDTINVKTTSYMFYGDSRLTTINMANWDTTNITNVAGMFSNLSNIQDIDFTGWNLCNVTNAKSLVYNCRRISNELADKFVNILLTMTNLPQAQKVFNNTNANSPIYNSYITQANIPNRVQELIDAGWTF